MNRGSTPTPTLLRKREKERSPFAVAIRPNLIMLQDRSATATVRLRSTAGCGFAPIIVPPETGIDISSLARQAVVRKYT
jgi:hypothetical protein